MSSYLTKAGPINLAEDIPKIAPSEACEGSDTLLESVIYLDWRLFRAAGWRLFALAVDPPILQLAWRGFKAVERLERQIYTQFKEEAKEEGVVSC